MTEHFKSVLVSDEMPARLRRNGERKDFVAGGILLAAILLFVGTGSTAISSILQSATGNGQHTNNILGMAVILNVAIILFGWRRYRDLEIEVELHAAAEQRARQLANTNPLTGFYNRRSIAHTASRMIEKAMNTDKSVAVFMLDLDQYKTVNDVYDHAAGDAVLQVAAERIKSIMPASTLKARLGGDEFVCVFLFDLLEVGIVETLAEKIVQSMAQPINTEQVHVSVSTSLGLAKLEDGAETIDALMRRANIAMYSAKDQSRNCYAWFSAAMERELHARNALEQGIRGGIPAGEFEPYFEQQVDLVTGDLIGFEMLARWRSPIHGVVSPEIFIPIAEESGLIADLSMAVMRSALDEARYWDPSLTLSVNISPAQLKDTWLAQKIVKLLVETGYPAHRLEIEITESSLFENLGLAKSIIGSLKNQGIQISLDDFGTGYSSLAHLRALPFDCIKIDRSFVSSMNANSDSIAIVGAILRLGESLNMPITAEGIEDEATVQQLIALGCAKGQGYHYGRPLTIAQTRVLLGERGLMGNAPALPEDDDMVSVIGTRDYAGFLRRAG